MSKVHSELPSVHHGRWGSKLHFLSIIFCTSYLPHNEPSRTFVKDQSAIHARTYLWYGTTLTLVTVAVEYVLKLGHALPTTLFFYRLFCLFGNAKHLE